MISAKESLFFTYIQWIVRCIVSIIQSKFDTSNFFERASESCCHEGRGKKKSKSMR